MMCILLRLFSSDGRLDEPPKRRMDGVGELDVDCDAVQVWFAADCVLLLPAYLALPTRRIGGGLCIAAYVYLPLFQMSLL